MHITVQGVAQCSRCGRGTFHQTRRVSLVEIEDNIAIDSWSAFAELQDNIHTGKEKELICATCGKSVLVSSLHMTIVDVVVTKDKKEGEHE